MFAYEVVSSGWSPSEGYLLIGDQVIGFGTKVVTLITQPQNRYGRIEALSRISRPCAFTVTNLNFINNFFMLVFVVVL